MVFTYWEKKSGISDLEIDLAESGFVMEKANGSQVKSSFWDSYDKNLLGKGLTIIKTGNRWQVWNINDWQPLDLDTSKRGSEETPKLWQTFDEGSFRDWIKKNLGLNALVRMAFLDFGFEETIFKNSDGKIVVKIFSILLENRKIHKVSGLKGYEDEYSRITQLLSSFAYSLRQNEWFNGILQYSGVNMYHEIPLKELLPSGEIPIRRAVSDMILNYLHIARFYEEGIQKDPDTECLHKYRVALRKVRSLLSIIKEIYPQQDSAMLKADFKELQQNTNRLRDLDVHLMEENKYKSMLPDTFRDNIHSLFEELKKERKVELNKIRKILESDDYKNNMRKLEEYFERIYKIPHTTDSIKPVNEVAKNYTQSLYSKMVKNINKINDDTPEEQIHKLRITGKKLRYLLEFFEPVLLSGPRKKLTEASKRIQDELGRFNDQCSQIEYLSEKVNNAKTDGVDSVALGVLIGVIYCQKQIQRKIVISKISDFSSKQVKSIVSELTR